MKIKQGFIRKTKNNLFMLESLIKEMKHSIKKGLLNFPNSKEVEALKDEWDRVINTAKRVKLNPECSNIENSRSESVFLNNEGNLKKKLIRVIKKGNLILQNMNKKLLKKKGILLTKYPLLIWVLISLHILLKK